MDGYPSSWESFFSFLKPFLIVIISFVGIYRVSKGAINHSFLSSKLCIPSTINSWNKSIVTVIWADKNELVSGRLAKVKPWIVNNILNTPHGLYMSKSFLRAFFLTIDWCFNLLLQTQFIVADKRYGRCLEYLWYITLSEISAEQLRLSCLDASHALRYGCSVEYILYNSK